MQALAKQAFWKCSPRLPGTPQAPTDGAMSFGSKDRRHAAFVAIKKPPPSSTAIGVAMESRTASGNVRRLFCSGLSGEHEFMEKMPRGWLVAPSLGTWISAWRLADFRDHISASLFDSERYFA
jgi:hypothetical protein